MLVLQANVSVLSTELETVSVIQELGHNPDQFRYGALPVTLAGRKYNLPWKYIGPEDNKDKGDLIAYYRPDQEELLWAGVSELVPTLDALGTSAIITPASSKSGRMVAETRRRLKEILRRSVELTIFARGRAGSEGMYGHLQNAAASVNYSPITANGAEITMSISDQQAE